MKLRVACLLATLMAAPALADASDDPTVLGSWSFVANTYDGCDFTGIMHLGSGERPDIHACELTARQACPDVTYVVRQPCRAQRSGDQLIVRSQIAEFLEGEPTPGYWPDNFILTVKTSSRMIGALLSHGSHASEFTRLEEGVS